MNGYELLKAMNGTDEKYIEMSERFRGQYHRPGKVIKFAVCAAAAAAMLSIGAYASGAFDTFGKFFKGDVSPFESELLSTVQTVSNDDLTMTIDGIIADEVECKILVSIYANDSDGRKIIKQINNSRYGDDEKYTGANHEIFLEHHGYNYFEGQSYEDESLVYPDLNNRNEYHTLLSVEMSRIDLSQPFKLTEQESGLSIDFDIDPYLESYRMVSDDANAFEHVVLSPMGVHIRSTQRDLDRQLYLSDPDKDDIMSIYVNYSDGNSTELDGVSICEEFHSGEELPTDDRFEIFDHEFLTDQRLDASVLSEGKENFISTEGVVSVTIDGIEYKTKTK